MHNTVPPPSMNPSSIPFLVNKLCQCLLLLSRLTSLIWLSYSIILSKVLHRGLSGSGVISLAINRILVYQQGSK